MTHYRIREVDGEESADILTELHNLTFFDSAPMPNFSNGHWWLAVNEKEAVAFIGIIQSILDEGTGYFTRVGVIPEHRGNKLQQRLQRVIERKARHNSWYRIVTDTTDNIPSANNIISAGYKLFEPPVRWAFPNSLYWQKSIERN